MPLQLLLIWLWPSGAKWLPHIYHRGLCLLLGIRVEVSGQGLPPGPCLVVSNHVSWIDILVLSSVAPLSFVAKREVAGWPLFGLMAKLQRTVFVDRDKRHATGLHRNELQVRLSGSETLVLFPEGTSSDGASVLPFKSSFFAAATAPDVSVVPVSLAYRQTYNLPLTRRNRPHFAWYADMELVPHLWAVLCGGPLLVTVVVHDALGVEARAQRKRAASVAEATVRRGLLEALHGRGDLR